MATESLFRVIAGAFLAIGFSISGYYRRRANQAGDTITFDEEGKWMRRSRNSAALLGYGAILAYLIYPPLIAWAQVELPLWLRWAGAGMMAVSTPLIYWLFSSLGQNVTPTVAIREDHRLITQGPYKWIRHPLYSFATFNFLGLSLMAANWFMALMITLGFITLAWRTPLEEQKLIEAFGDEYRDYMQRTGRYLPKLGGL